jgi:hypothetical protein
LSKEDREGSEGSIFDGVLGVLAAALVRQAVKLVMEGLDECIKAERIGHTCSVV